MYRSRSSLSYDILHGIQFPTNLSIIFAYMSYFPPPPPVLPGPPPRRSWICSSHSFSSLSCFVSDDRNPLSLHEYIPLNDYNQSTLLTNTSYSSINSSSYSIKSSSLFDYIINLFQNQFLFILLFSFILCILLFLIFIFILFIYLQRQRQRQLISNNKNKKFYYRLIPHRYKHQIIINNNEHKLVHLRKDSFTSQVIRISTASGIHTNNNNETEEAV